MKTAGIICEYNPFHLGHLNHIEKTKAALGGDAGIVCIMSGNVVQRGDFAVYNKHARAKAAVLCGADLVIELPAPYALGSAREFAKAGIFLLDSLCMCDVLSFGSESGSIDELENAAYAIASERAEEYIKTGLSAGLSYASAQQKAADALHGINPDVFRSPNNILAIEYIKALSRLRSDILPMTIKRSGGDHDGDTGYSASAIRKSIINGKATKNQMPADAAAVYKEETEAGRGPVFMNELEQAMLSRLRIIEDFSIYPAATDGLDRRLIRLASSAPSVLSLMESAKTKRYAMSRIRRVIMCAVLGIKNKDASCHPPYIRILAMNKRGAVILKNAGKTAKLPIITKPASVMKLDKQAVRTFKLESAVTDFYALAYKNDEVRRGGDEWRKSPIVLQKLSRQFPDNTLSYRN